MSFPLPIRRTGQSGYQDQGTSITWVGSAFDLSSDADNATATWSIDAGEVTKFTLDPHVHTRSALGLTFGRVYFTTPEIRAGPHNLTVTYLGSGKIAQPLSLQYLLVKYSTAAGASSSGNGVGIPSQMLNPTPASTGNPGGNSGGPSRTSIGAIVGGVLGAFVLLISIFTIFVWWRWRVQQRNKNRLNPYRGPFDPEERNTGQHLPLNKPGASPNTPVTSPAVSAPPTVRKRRIPGTHVAGTSTSSISIRQRDRDGPVHESLIHEGPAPMAEVNRSTDVPQFANTGDGRVDRRNGISLQPHIEITADGNTVFRHADSGIRLHEDTPQIEELLPRYTSVD